MLRLIEIAKRLRALAQNGLHYTESHFDRERYEELHALALESLGLLTQTPLEPLELIFEKQVGYATPKVDIRAVVFRNEKLLMVQESEDGGWSLPGGWADVGFSPAEVAEKEVWEEAGLKVKAKRLIGILDKKNHAHPPSPFYTYKIFIHCEPEGGMLTTNHETLDVGFFGADEIPPLSVSRLTPEQVKRLFAFQNLDHPMPWLE